MLKEIRGTAAIVVCPNCHRETEHNLKGKRSVFLEEFNEYENIELPCSHCDSVKVLNMNIPENDTDEQFETGDLPTEEEIQRYFVRVIQRMTREDFLQGKEENL